MREFLTSLGLLARAVAHSLKRHPRRVMAGVGTLLLGTGVTAFGIFLTPVFYVLMRKLAGNRPLARHDIEQPVLQAAE